MSATESIKALRARISSLRRSTRFVWRRESGALADDIDEIRTEIARTFATDEPKVAAKLLEALVRSADRVFQRVDDSDGMVGDAFRETVRDWGAVWALVTDRDPIALAMLVFRESEDNDFGVKDRIIAAFSSALGKTGLAELGKRYAAILAMAPLGEKAQDARWTAGRRLGEIADELGDVDGYIAAMKSIGYLEIEALGIAQRLSDAGRLEEALAALERIRANVSKELRAIDLRIAILEKLSRTEEAQALRWAMFEQRLSPSHFLAYRARVGVGAQTSVTERAIERASSAPLVLEALWFLTEIDELGAAEEFILGRGAKIDGEAYTTLRCVAKMLAKPHPLGALVLHRIMALAVLARANSTYYPYAIKDIRVAEKLAASVGDWREVTNHKGFIDEIRRLHKLKSAFWKRFEG